MNCQEILKVLVWYRGKMMELLGQEDISVSNEYSFIDVNNEIRFEASDHSAVVISKNTDLKIKLDAINWPGLRSTNAIRLPWSQEIIQQLETVDNIASLGASCTVGDDYRPGNFSKILLSSQHIELQQVNYMNARSLDHKDDYSLRSLVFRIPLDGKSKIITEFTDRSSQNNRHCGEKIKAAIDWTI